MAVQETVVVVKTLNIDPDAGAQTVGATPEPSVAVTLEAKFTTGSGRLSVDLVP